MTVRCSVIMPVAAALGALTSTAPATDANAASSSNEQPKPIPQTAQANTLVSVGQELLAFTVNEQPDGTVVAQHVSHASHSSHSSHHSSR